MTISDKTRKILWGRSGNRCAICERELVTEATSQDQASLVGEECHIVARELNGPRGNSDIPIDQRDEYDNLILLCCVHHKLIDDQVNTYDIAYLKKTKTDHERWVHERLTLKRSNFDPKEPYTAHRIDSGQSLLSLAIGCHASRFQNDQPKNEQEAIVIGDFAQGIQDYVDIWDEMEGRDRVLAQIEIDKALRELDTLGYVVYGSQRKEQFKSMGEPVIFDVVTVLVISKSNSIVVRKEEAIENAMQLRDQQSSIYTNFVLVQHT